MPSKIQTELVEITVSVIKYPIKKDLNRFFLDCYQPLKEKGLSLFLFYLVDFLNKVYYNL